VFPLYIVDAIIQAEVRLADEHGSPERKAAVGINNQSGTAASRGRPGEAFSTRSPCLVSSGVLPCDISGLLPHVVGLQMLVDNSHVVMSEMEVAFAIVTATGQPTVAGSGLPKGCDASVAAQTLHWRGSMTWAFTAPAPPASSRTYPQ
jgi:hypothetical protein